MMQSPSTNSCIWMCVAQIWSYIDQGIWQRVDRAVQALAALKLFQDQASKDVPEEKALELENCVSNVDPCLWLCCCMFMVLRRTQTIRLIWTINIVSKKIHASAYVFILCQLGPRSHWWNLMGLWCWQRLAMTSAPATSGRLGTIHLSPHNRSVSMCFIFSRGWYVTRQLGRSLGVSLNTEHITLEQI